MSGSTIKWIVIATLFLINVFFLAVIIIDTVADARDERLMIENICAVVQNGGIMINPDDVKTGGAIRTMRTARGDEAEAAIARAVLGTTVMSDQGVIYSYENPEQGIAEFYSAGDFTIRLNDGVVTNSSGTLRTVQRLLRDMKLETASITVSGAAGNETVTALSAYRGASVFNCTVEFIFSGGYLSTISGRYMTGIEAAEDGSEISSVGTALLGFLASVRDGEYECTHIYSVEAGYQHRVVGSFGEGVLVPAWLIDTDTGRYIIED